MNEQANDKYLRHKNGKYLGKFPTKKKERKKVYQIVKKNICLNMVFFFLCKLNREIRNFKNGVDIRSWDG